MKLITASKMICFLTCQRKFWLNYVARLKAVKESDSFHFGHIWHSCLESRAKGDAYEFALSQVRARDEITMATVAGLLAGYYRRYDGQPDPTTNELEFREKMGVYGWRAAGKIDGLTDTFILERKTCSDDIGPDSDYWLKLRGNIQLMHYSDASGRRRAVYDVTRKPTIRQKQNETPEQYGQRLFADTQERPEYYYARREIEISDHDLDEFVALRREVCWQIDTLHKRRTDPPEHAWTPCRVSMTCRFCEYSGFCLNNTALDMAQPPTGFAVGREHAELDQV